MKRITVVLENEVHKKAKVKAVMEDMSIIKYVAKLVEKDLETKKEQTQ